MNAQSANNNFDENEVLKMEDNNRTYAAEVFFDLEGKTFTYRKIAKTLADLGLKKRLVYKLLKEFDDQGYLTRGLNAEKVSEWTVTDNGDKIYELFEKYLAE